jgi:hypothetical protein
VKELEYGHFVKEGAMLVTVHRYRVYDILNDEYRTSTRMATAEKIAKIGGEIIPGSAYPLDSDELDDGPERITNTFWRLLRNLRKSLITSILMKHAALLLPMR